jgi:hypothetical protein
MPILKEGKMERLKVKAIATDEIALFLSKAGVLDEVEKGYIRCAKCDSIITLQNIGMIKRKEDKLLIFCDNEQCVMNEQE